MTQFLRVLLVGCAWSVSYALLGGDTELLGQQVKETISLKQHSVKFDKDWRAATARIGEGHLRQMDATLVEIPPGGQLAPHRHLAEEMIYIVSGKGYTLMWSKSPGKKERYEWAEGDLLSPSLNAWHQHFNASSESPVRYLSITTSPLTENVFNNHSFLSSLDFSFEDRWSKAVVQQPEYVGNVTEGSENVRMNVGHYLPNLPGRKMKNTREDVTGITITTEGDLAGNHLMEMEVREYLKGDATSPHHRHLWETVYYVLNGEGYALLQREGEPERRVEWKKGDLFIVEAHEYHQHRARRGASVRLLQIKASGYFRDVGIENYLMQTGPRIGERNNTR